MSLVLSGDAPSLQSYQGGAVTAGTAVASTSGTSIDFTSIPSWVKRITVLFAGVSTSGASYPLVQLGAGSITNSGYIGSSIESAASKANFTTGFGITAAAAANVIYGQMVISLTGSNQWVSSSALIIQQSGNGYPIVGSGVVTLGGTLDRVRITTVNGTDTFDAGSINILYE